MKALSRLLPRGMAVGSLFLGVGVLHLCAAAEGKSAASVAELIVTVQSRSDSGSLGLQADDVTVHQGNSVRKIVGFDRLSGEEAAMQLFIYLGGSIRTETLETLLPDLKNFVQTLPANSEVAVGTLHNGELRLEQAFTTDHQTAARALRAQPQLETSDGPYSALLYLTKRWPSQERMGRRAVLMLTDGNERDYGAPATDDPYVEAAIRNSQIAGIAVYSVYMRGTGFYTPSEWALNLGQSNLLGVSNATGGHFYCEGLNDPVLLGRILRT
jgi:hypothetical protein